jgi:hypothetical protein
MFRLPGLVIKPEAEETVDAELLNKMEEWCKSELGKGMRMTDNLFSFRNEKQRDWFILRWSGETE